MIEHVPTSILSEERCHLGEGPTYQVRIRYRAVVRHPRREAVRGPAFERPDHRAPARPHGEVALAYIDLARQLIVAEDGLYISHHRRRRRWRLFPRPSLRPPARLALPAARGDRREDQAASRSAPRSSTCATRTRSTWPRMPARPISSPAGACSSASAAARPSRLSMAGAISATRRPRARPMPTWAGVTPKSFSTCCAARASREPNPRPMFPNPPGLLRLEPHSRRPARAHLVGRRLERHGGLGGEARHEPAELDAQERRDRRALPRPAGRPDPRLPRGLEGSRPRARPRASRSAAASSRWSTIATAPISAMAARKRTRSASSTRRRGPSSAAATPPSPTS